MILIIVTCGWTILQDILKLARIRRIFFGLLAFYNAGVILPMSVMEPCSLACLHFSVYTQHSGHLRPGNVTTDLGGKLEKFNDVLYLNPTKNFYQRYSNFFGAFSII